MSAGKKFPFDLMECVDTDNKLVNVNISSGSSGGVQYYDSKATSASATGTLMLGDDGSNFQSVAVDSSGNVQVDVVGSLPAGTNAIGKLAANSGVDIGDVDILTQPARAATTDTITAKIATDKIQNGTTALTPKFAIISTSASGNTEVVAAVASNKIRVLAYNFMANGTVNVKFQGGTTNLNGLSYLVANTGKVAPFNPVGWLETGTASALNINLSANVAVGGEVVYVEVG